MSAKGPIRTKKAGKKGMSLEEVLKIEKIRGSAPLQIMDGLKVQRGRPKRHWPNPVTRLNKYEDVSMVVDPQTTLGTQSTASKRPKPKVGGPPLKIIFDSYPGSKKIREDAPVPSWQRPKKKAIEPGAGAPPHEPPHAVSRAETGEPLRVHTHLGVVVPHGYGGVYDDLRISPRSPNDSLSNISSPPGSYPPTPLSAHSYQAPPGLVSPPNFYHSPSELGNTVPIPSISLPPPMVSSQPPPTPWQPLPNLHTLEYGRGGHPSSWSWDPHLYSSNGYPPNHVYPSY